MALNQHPHRQAVLSGFWRILLLATAVLILVGCSRTRYRLQADQEVGGAVVSATADPRFRLDEFTVTPDPRSRMFDPLNPDCPPMPPDDPDSHRLMHCVDCKKGWRCWHKYGDAPSVENPGWEIYLPRSEKGDVVLDRQGAVQVALVNSRDYQDKIESLYLSALDVTLQRFSFDTQLTFTNRTAYTASDPSGAGNSSRTLSNDTAFSGKRLFASGGELVVGLANSIVWQFSGPDTMVVNSPLTFSVFQPLLRNAGRAVVLEALTDSERALLANVRQMEQYRRDFYANLVIGRGTGTGPVAGRLRVDGLDPGSVSRGAGGFLAILEEQVRIRNQQANISGLKRSLDQLQAQYEAGRLRDRFQVDLPRQALYRAQIGLLSSLTDYENTLDTYKILLGLPPDLDVQVSDPLLARFDLIEPAITRALDRADEFLALLFNPAQPVPEDWRERLIVAGTEGQSHMRTVEGDLKILRDAIPARRQNLSELTDRPEIQSSDFERVPYEVRTLDERVVRIEKDYQATVLALAGANAELEAVPVEPARPASDAPEEDPTRRAWEAWRGAVIRSASRFANVLSDLSLIQARARLEAVTLVRVDLAPEQAIGIARENRPDWMNARAALVDIWRKIEVTANALKAGLDVHMEGELGTARGAAKRLQARLEFDAPLTRLVERNVYRKALLEYQQSRRAYQFFEDRVSQNLRTALRGTRLSQLNFEIRRAAVRVAIDQVEITRLRIQQPPKPGETSEASMSVGRDLVDALNNLLTTQNEFLGAWVDYEAQRLDLDFELGTMRLDDHGMWIDPGAIDAGYIQGQKEEPSPAPPEILPLPPAAT